MANIKSQIKRNRQNENRRLRNRNVRGSARSAVNQARAAFEENAPETKEAVLKAISALDKAAEKGVIHRNNAARRKGRLMKHLAALGDTPVKDEAATKKTTAKKN
ncbi:MAG TPA: 30S ribosomal protein S20 [Anaerolineales bacterium]